MLGFDALYAGENFFTLVSGLLQVGLESTTAGDVVMTAQKLAGVTHLFSFTADGAYARHIY